MKMTLKTSVQNLENPRMTQKKSSNISEKHICDFCGRKVARVQTLAKHLEACPKREKFLRRSTEVGKLAFDIWAAMYKNPDIEKFERSNLYPSMVNFVEHCLANNYHLIYEFGVWLIQNKVHMAKWTKPETFSQFIGLFILQETPRNAIIRSIDYIIGLGKYGEFFKTHECGKIILSLENGKLSPWMLFVTHNPEDFLGRLNDHQVQYFQKVVNMDIWPKKVERFKKTVETLREELKGIEI